jgi:hypothetical protein
MKLMGVKPCLNENLSFHDEESDCEYRYLYNKLCLSEESNIAPNDQDLLRELCQWVSSCNVPLFTTTVLIRILHLPKGLLLNALTLMHTSRSMHVKKL